MRREIWIWIALPGISQFAGGEPVVAQTPLLLASKVEGTVRKELHGAIDSVYWGASVPASAYVILESERSALELFYSPLKRPITFSDTGRYLVSDAMDPHTVSSPGRWDKYLQPAPANKQSIVGGTMGHLGEGEGGLNPAKGAGGPFAIVVDPLRFRFNESLGPLREQCVSFSPSKWVFSWGGGSRMWRFTLVEINGAEYQTVFVKEIRGSELEMDKERDYRLKPGGEYVWSITQLPEPLAMTGQNDRPVYFTVSTPEMEKGLARGLEAWIKRLELDEEETYFVSGKFWDAAGFYQAALYYYEQGVLDFPESEELRQALLESRARLFER